MQYSSLETFGHAIQHSFVLAWGHMNASMTRQVIKECTVFIFPAPQVGSGKKNMHDSMGIVKHVWNPSFTTCSFPQVAGKDMVNACWKDCDFCSNFHAENTACTFK